MQAISSCSKQYNSCCCCCILVYVKNKFSIHSAKIWMNRTKIEQINNTSVQKTRLFLFNPFLELVQMYLLIYVVRDCISVDKTLKMIIGFIYILVVLGIVEELSRYRNSAFFQFLLAKFCRRYKQAGQSASIDFIKSDSFSVILFNVSMDFWSCCNVCCSFW